jgi:hypothetical protein
MQDMRAKYNMCGWGPGTETLGHRKMVSWIKYVSHKRGNRRLDPQHLQNVGKYGDMPVILAVSM